MTLEPGIRFTHAICRTPGNSIAQGIRAGDGTDPDPALFRTQHGAYITALENAGVEVTCLPALEQFPDSVFVEDPALCLPEGAVLLRPGSDARLGEASEILPTLKEQFDVVHVLEGPGLVDGGDIMVTDDEILVGLSARTNEEGFAELETILKEMGHRARMVQTPPSILHFKTGSSYLGDNIVLCVEEMAQTDAFEGYDLLYVPSDEATAANCIRVNDTIFVSAGFPKTADVLRIHFPHVEVVELDTSEAALVDGGLSCLSLRFYKE